MQPDLSYDKPNSSLKKLSKTTLIFWLTLALVGTLLLTACGNENPTAPATIKSSQAPVNLRIMAWENSSPNDAVREINARFKQKYPNITIEFTTAPTPNYDDLHNLRLKANTIDIFATFGLGNGAKDWTPNPSKPLWQEMVEGGLIEDLTGKTFLKNYDPQALKDASSYNGKVYTVTTGKVIHNGVYYNKEVFERLKLQPPTTFKELVKIAETLEANNLTAFSLGGADTWPINFLFNNLTTNFIPDTEAVVKGLWAGTIKWTDPRLVKVLEHAETMMNFMDKDFLRVSNREAVKRFAEGKVAMLPTGIWEAPEIGRLNPGLKFGYFILPSSDNPAENNTFGGKYDLAWAVNARTSPAQKEAAMLWLDFFSSPKNYADYVNAAGFLPVQPNINLNSEFLKGVLAMPQAANFKLDWEQVGVPRQGADKYTASMRIQLQYLAPAGPYAPLDLAQLAQTEWDNSLPSNKR